MIDGAIDLISEIIKSRVEFSWVVDEYPYYKVRFIFDVLILTVNSFIAESLRFCYSVHNYINAAIVVFETTGDRAVFSVCGREM